MTVRDEFSGQAFAIQILVDDAGVVTQVLVGRRPPGLYGGSDRSHLTAWKVFVDGVRNHVVGLSTGDALERMLWIGGIAERHAAHAFAGQLRDESMKVIRDRRKLEGDKAGGVKRRDDAEHEEAPPKKKQRTIPATKVAVDMVEDEPDAAAEPEGYPVMTPRIWYGTAVRHWDEAKGLATDYLAPTPQPSLDLADLTSSAELDDVMEPEEVMVTAPSPDIWGSLPDDGMPVDEPSAHTGSASSGDESFEEPDSEPLPDPVFTADQEYELGLLQTLIAAYLHYRNTLPLTAVHETRPKGPAAGAANKVMAVEKVPDTDHDDELSDDAKMTLSNSLWGLFDSGALENLITDGDAKEKLFGKDRENVENKKICLAAVADHILSVEVAYPRTTARSKPRTWGRPFTSRSSFKAWEDKLDSAGDDLPATVSPGPATGLLPSGEEANDQQTRIYDRFAVQLDLDTDGTVRKMYVGSRPKSRKGRHTTAWVVLCDYLRSFVVGADLDAIDASLTREFTKISAFYAACDIEEPDPLDAYFGSALECAQLRIVDFLDFLNNTVGAVVDTGGLSGGNAEGHHRKVMQRAGQYSTVLSMFDPLCPAKLLDQITDGDSQDGHTYDTTPTLGLRVALHLHMTSLAYGGQMTPDVAAGLRDHTGLALLHASYGIQKTTAHPINEKIWATLTATPGVDPRPYDPDTFEDLYDDFTTTATGSDDEFTTTGSLPTSQ